MPPVGVEWLIVMEDGHGLTGTLTTDETGEPDTLTLAGRMVILLRRTDSTPDERLLSRKESILSGKVNIADSTTQEAPLAIRTMQPMTMPPLTQMGRESRSTSVPHSFHVTASRLLHGRMRVGRGV